MLACANLFASLTLSLFPQTIRRLASSASPSPPPILPPLVSLSSLQLLRWFSFAAASPGSFFSVCFLLAGVYHPAGGGGGDGGVVTGCPSFACHERERDREGGRGGTEQL